MSTSYDGSSVLLFVLLILLLFILLIFLIFNFTASKIICTSDSLPLRLLCTDERGRDLARSRDSF